MSDVQSPKSKVLDQDDETLAKSGFYWREAGGVKVLVSRSLEDAGFVNGFSTRVGGVSPFPAGSLNLAGFDDDTAENIFENRRRFLAAFGGDLTLALAWQVHGDAIRMVETIDDVGDSEIKADAVMSNLQGVLAAVKTADCVPILIGDRETGAFVAVHAGWRGTVQSIVKKAVAKLQETYGSNPSDMIAAIGPAASCESYEIGREVIDEFDQNFGEASKKYFTPTRDGHALVDLHAANRDQLTTAGLTSQNIFSAPFCTMERGDLFFSYRREKPDFGKTGRLLSVIGRNA
ncbi:MAG: peptidoglycan editing factor PgeF [Pyrinomonadaceae bacterium]